MKADPDQPLIVSASRTKDMVHRSPGLLAEILLGRVPCRWGPHGPRGQVNPAHLHSVVLWTKDPRNLLDHSGLRNTLLKLHNRFEVQISLQLTATGLGGSFIEPGIPAWEDVFSNLSALFSQGWISPQAVVYRFDPFLSVRTPGGKLISNANISLFERLVSRFLSLGIPRVTASRADAVRYPRVAERVRALSLDWIHIPDEEAAQLCDRMASICGSMGADFSVCCEPQTDPLLNKWGCIDSRWLNKIKGEDFPAATEVPHNKIGKQRPNCRCTYSRDIGYSPGSATCFSGGYGCLYCYSQGNAKPPHVNKILREIEAFDSDPSGYLASRNLPRELYFGS